MDLLPQLDKAPWNTQTTLNVQAGDASGTGLFDTANRKYDKQRLGSIDSALEEKFPQLIGPNEVGTRQRSAPVCLACLTVTLECY